jgi:hypothetical protein
MLVLISWSGERAKQMALSLREWITHILQAVKPFVSERDIAPGERWEGYCIVCVTVDNIREPWLNFEAGVVAGRHEGRICPYLLDVDPGDLSPMPLAHQQAGGADKAGTFALMKSLNGLLEQGKISDKELELQFEKWWPDLENMLKAIAPSKPQPKPSPEAVLEEVLRRLRGPNTVEVFFQQLGFMLDEHNLKENVPEPGLPEMGLAWAVAAFIERERARVQRGAAEPLSRALLSAVFDQKRHRISDDVFIPLVSNELISEWSRIPATELIQLLTKYVNRRPTVEEAVRASSKTMARSNRRADDRPRGTTLLAASESVANLRLQ